MAKQLITWQEKVSATTYDTIYPETLSEQVHINNKIASNLGISPDVSLDTALEKLSVTDKNIRAQGVATGTATALTLSVNVFTLFDGVVVRAKIPFDTEKGLTLNVNNTGAKSIYRIDGQPIDLVLKSGAWCTFIYSSALDGWVLQGWSTKSVLKTEVITKTQTWTVPDGVTSVNVFLFGGGGGGGSNAHSEGEELAKGGGGGGGYMAKSTLTVTPKQSISITIGAGGAVGQAGGTTSFGSLLSARGGSAGENARVDGTHGYGGKGGDGGSGGAGSIGTYLNYRVNCGAGGNGAQFGGGAGSYEAKGGNGGTYGGGGGAGGSYSGSSSGGTGGQYGGAGGNSEQNGTNGTNTTNVADIDFRGLGKAGTGYSDDGGGGGGGGYGGNGGNGGFYEGGGGGGYGGNGGNSGGGGGGYGAPAYGKGGGGYGVNNYGHGGDIASAGASGICIITYTAQES